MNMVIFTVKFDKLPSAYRHSFRHYNEMRLLVSITYFGVAFGLFFGMFIVRYRMELILSVPFIAGFVAWYIYLGFLEDSPVQNPEKLFQQPYFLSYACLCVCVFFALLFVDVPWVANLFVPTIPSQQVPAHL